MLSPVLSPRSSAASISSLVGRRGGRKRDGKVLVFCKALYGGLRRHRGREGSGLHPRPSRPSWPSGRSPPAFRRRPKAHLERAGKACADVAPSAIVPTIISRIARSNGIAPRISREAHQRPSRSQGHHTTPEPPCQPRPSRGGRHGSFPPCPAFVRSRGSPNFLSWAILKLMHVSINAGGCMHRSGQRSRRNGHQ
jgi:hypothetical protein